jgi:hypothetical protein
VERGKAETSYIPQRSPAWCDWVLVRSNLPHKQASFVDYYSAPQVTTSDHKPVGALLQVRQYCACFSLVFKRHDMCDVRLL